MALLTIQTVKKLNFTMPRWRTAAILKTVKSSYLYKRSTDFDEIWQIIVSVHVVVHQIVCRLRLVPRPHWVSLQRSPRNPYINVAYL